MEDTIRIIGIDPGKDGGISVIDNYGFIKELHTIPKISDANVDYLRLIDIFKSLSGGLTYCFLEDVHSLVCSSKKSNFSFGGIVEVKKVLAMEHLQNVTIVPPKKWQAEMFKGVKPIMKVVRAKDKETNEINVKVAKDTKKMALLVARSVFSQNNFLANDRCRMAHDGLVDASLIAEYGRRSIFLPNNSKPEVEDEQE